MQYNKIDPKITLLLSQIVFCHGPLHVLPVFVRRLFELNCVRRLSLFHNYRMRLSMIVNNYLPKWRWLEVDIRIQQCGQIICQKKMILTQLFLQRLQYFRMQIPRELLRGEKEGRKPLLAAGMLADNVHSRDIVRKMNIWSRSDIRV